MDECERDAVRTMCAAEVETKTNHFAGISCHNTHMCRFLRSQRCVRALGCTRDAYTSFCLPHYLYPRRTMHARVWVWVSLPLFFGPASILARVRTASRWCTNAIAVVVLIVISLKTGRMHTIVSGERTSVVLVSWASNCCWTLAKIQAAILWLLFFRTECHYSRIILVFGIKRLDDTWKCERWQRRPAKVVRKKGKQNDNGNGKIQPFSKWILYTYRRKMESFTKNIEKTWPESIRQMQTKLQ